MWTPKRILLLAAGFVCFCAGYVGYAYSSLGYIDGLPPLPEAYKPDDRPGPPRVFVRREPRVHDKLRQAFGIGCEELTWPIKLELNARSMVLASQNFSIEPNGDVRLTPLRVAVFGKKKVEGRDPEINTIKGKTARLKFDRPIKNIQEISGRKIVEAWLYDDIQIVNNRRTLVRTDDLVVLIAKGPLHYIEAKHFIETADHVKLTDHKCQPKPTEIVGQGMEMDLLAEPKPARPAAGFAAPAKKSESVSGVKRIVLLSNVQMNLYVDNGSGFMGGTKPKPTPVRGVEAKDGRVVVDGDLKGKKTEPRPPAAKDHLLITTPGRFQYDFLKDHDLATFDLPKPDPLRQPLMPQDVEVRRHQEELGTWDVLQCQHLVLRLRHKEAGATAGAAERAPEQGLDIETLHATAFPGRQVTLTSDREKLYAHGNDLFYDAPQRLTILKGEPQMEANRDGNIIHAREMQIRDREAPECPGGPPKAYQEVTAHGPGHIRMVEKQPDKGADKAPPPKTTLQAYWTDRLVSTKDGPSDLLVLTGQARFVDESHTPPQSLQGDTLKVWLTPAPGNDKDKKPAAAGPAPEQGRRPQHLEAIGNVISHSPQLNIHDTSRLVVWFKDVVTAAPPAAVAAAKTLPPKGAPKAAPGGAGAPRPAAGGATTPNGGPRLPEVNPAPGTARPAATTAGPSLLGPPGPARPGAKEEPARPIDLSAHSVEARVLREGDKSTLETLWTEGDVRVRQDPAKPGEQGVDITGKTLHLTWNPAGNLLVVTDEEDLAKLLMDKMWIWGPEVNIDQATNKAWVVGSGAMRMESATDFQGKPTAQPVPLVVHWNKDMFFNGEYAEFRGGIQAEQGNARMAGQRLQVFFDRPISLKEGNRGDQPAKVRNLVCDKDVRVEESTYEARPPDAKASGAPRLVKYQLLLATGLDVTTLEPDGDVPTTAKGKEGNLVRASGAGSIRIWQPGSSDPAAPPRPDGPAPKPPPGTKPDDEEMKLTYITFGKRMDANSKTNTASFYENVRVLNLPSDTPHRAIDLDAIIANMPEGAMYLRSDRLKVLNQPENGRNNQQLEAHGHVWLQGKLYFGRAAAVYYNEAKDQVIFDGEEGGTATLTKQAEPGGKMQMLTGRKIFYNRKTGAARVDGGDTLNGIQQPN